MRQYSIDYGKRMSIKQKEKERQLINDINECCKKTDLSEKIRRNLIGCRLNRMKCILIKHRGHLFALELNG